MPVQASGETESQAYGLLSGVQLPKLLKVLFDVVQHSQQHLKLHISRHVNGRRQIGIY